MSRFPVDDAAYRRLKANQEPLLPGLAYAGVAAIGGAMFVNRVPRASVKILTPLALAAVTGSYFLPAHTDLIMGAFHIPLRVSRVGHDATTTTRDSMKDLKRSVDGATFDLGHKTVEAVDDVSRQAQASWDDIKTKAEKLADTYREAGQDQVNKVVEKSVQEAKHWLDHQKSEADRLLNETASVLTTTAAATAAAKTKASGLTSSLPSDHTNRFHDFDRANTASQKTKESMFYSQTSGDKPSSSRWSWWSSSDSIAPKKEVETKIHREGEGSTIPKKVERPESTASSKPRKIVVDKAVATAAIRQHDKTINRAAMLGKNAEETARKVHGNVVDAALTKRRQSTPEVHKIEVSRRASESDLRDGKFIVREIKNEDEEVQRVKLKAMKRDLDHGLQNLDKRAHMLYDGVEHLEHSINKRVEKALQEEADFWHQQSLKDQANNRGGDRAM